MELDKVKYVVLKDHVCYDRDNYDLFGCIYIDLETKHIYIKDYTHDTPIPYGDIWVTYYDFLQQLDNVGQDTFNEMVRELILDWMKSYNIMSETLSKPSCLCKLEFLLQCNIIHGSKLSNNHIKYIVKVERTSINCKKDAYRCLVVDMDDHICTWISYKNVEVCINDIIEKTISRAYNMTLSPREMSNIIAYSVCKPIEVKRQIQSLCIHIMNDANAGIANINLSEFKDPWKEHELEAKRIKASEDYSQCFEYIQNWAKSRFEKTKTPAEIDEIISNTMNKYYTI